MLEEEVELIEEEVQFHDMMELFEKLTFREKWNKVFAGLKMEQDAGEYKWARLQIKRLMAPVAGIIVPILLLFLMTLIAAITPNEKRIVNIVVLDQQEEEDLEPPLEIEEEPLEEPPDPTEEMEMFNEHDVMMDDVEPTPPSEFAPKPALFDSVALVKSPIIMRGIYGSRSPGSRGRARGQYGGNNMTEGAVMRALRWLKKNQNEDGSWNATKPAMTGLALLTFLAHGETPASAEFGMTVEYAIRWLIENQEADGRFKGRDNHDYSQPIAAYALCEAYGLTKVPSILEAATKAVTYVVKGQNKNGGFTYRLAQDGSGRKRDSSYMSWCTQALKAAYMAGMDVPGLDQAMKHAVTGWKANYKGDGSYGGFGYSGPHATHGLSGSGALCMMLLGEGNSREVRTTVASLDRATFNWDGTGAYNKMYYWYYITQVKFHEGDATWNSWNKLFAPVLIKEQIVEKGAIEGPGGKMFDIGHWAPGRQTSGHTDDEGRVMNTCLSALQLQVYYRYLPTFAQPDQADGGGIGGLLAGGVDKDIEVDIQIDGG